MTLDQFLSTSGLTAAEFGALCEPPISEASISRIRRGGQNITRATMLNIIATSKGKVSAAGLLAGPPQAEQAA